MRKASGSRGFCQFIVGGCVLLVVGALVLVGGIGYLFYRHSQPHPGPTPVATASPVAQSAPTLRWTGVLDCRGKQVPVNNYSGVCYLGSLELARILTSGELDRIHRKDGALLLDGHPVGQVVTLQGVEMVPIDPLLPTLGLTLRVDEAAHKVEAGAPAPTETASPR